MSKAARGGIGQRMERFWRYPRRLLSQSAGLPLVLPLLLGGVCCAGPQTRPRRRKRVVPVPSDSIRHPVLPSCVDVPLAARLAALGRGGIADRGSGAQDDARFSRDLSRGRQTFGGTCPQSPRRRAGPAMSRFLSPGANAWRPLPREGQATSVPRRRTCGRASIELRANPPPRRELMPVWT